MRPAYPAGAGMVNRHYHPQQVFAYTISGKWGYLEHDWVATKGDWIYEAPGEAHTLVAFSVTPLGAGENVGEIVAEAVRVVRSSGLPNRTDAMFTTVEGDWDEA